MSAIATRHALDVRIGGIGVRLDTDAPGFVATMAERFAGFTGEDGDPDYRFEIELIPAGQSGNQDVQVTREDGRWHVRRGDFHAHWDPVTRQGRARIVESPYSLDSVLRILHTLVLADEGGMLMHASSAVKDGRAYVFTGVSGIGKTTLSRLAPPGVHVLTDEMSFIRRTPAGYIACGTPFAGELARPGENLQAPLAGVFLLAQGPANRIEPLSPAEAVRGLMGNILYFARDPALTAQVFDNAIALASAVPVRRLTFVPDARVWDLIGSDA